MVNLLGVAEASAIEGLLARGWSQRRIARELGVHRETVGRYARLARERSRPAEVITGSRAAEGSKPAKVITGSAGGRSLSEPYRQLILEGSEAGLSATRIWQDLRFDHGATMGYQSVRRLVVALGRGRELPFRRLESGPGEEAQVDFGTGAPVVNERGRRGTKVLRASLSYSRKGHSAAVYREGTEEFLQCLEDAFWSWGGAARVVRIDQLRAAVQHPDWYDPELNPRVQSFCAHYGTVILPVKPRTPRHKGKIERQVGYVKNNGLKGRTFPSLVAENEYLEFWERNVADRRIHGTTRKQVGRAFEEEERGKLLPLPAGRFPFFHEGRRAVHRDGHVEVERAYYSVPPEYLGKRLWVRWDRRVVRVFNGRMEQVAMHVRREAGSFSTDQAHIAPEKISAVEAGPGPLLRKATRIGAHAGRWARELIDQRGVTGTRALLGLLSLSGRHRAAEIDEACRLASTHGIWRLRAVRELLAHRVEQVQIEFLEEHELIRSMSEYGAAVRDEGRAGDVPAPAPLGCGGASATSRL
jgi:transposase